jgi:hypothetical protein
MYVQVYLPRALFYRAMTISNVSIRISPIFGEVKDDESRSKPRKEGVKCFVVVMFSLKFVETTRFFEHPTGSRPLIFS